VNPSTVPCAARVYDGDFVVNDQESLDELIGYGEVRGDVTITRTNLVALTGRSCLHRIDGDLRIWSNQALRQMPALASLTELGGDLSIRRNALESLDALENLRLSGGVEIIACSSLESLEGLRVPTSLVSLVIAHNAGLTSLGPLSELRFVVIGLHLCFNQNLRDLGGLGALAHVGGDVVLEANDSLTSLEGLQALRSVGGRFFLTRNHVLEDVEGLRGLERVVEDFELRDNASLRSLSGLRSLVTVGQGLRLFNLPSLQDLGLVGLESVGGELRLEASPAVTAEAAALTARLRPHPVTAAEEAATP